MKAIGYVQSLPPTDPDSLFDFELATPTPGPRDLLVAVHAVSVNPIDTKVRMRAQGTPEQPKILGFDCAGVVQFTGPDATFFKPGDEVFYAGSILRPGTNSELHVVDERLVGPKPRSLSFAQAAALPLTSVTAWELLFDRLRLASAAGGPSVGPSAPLGREEKTPQSSASLLVIGASGGVGSILVQLARQLTGLTVLASASRPETQQWVLQNGAHHAIDHSKKLSQEVRALGIHFVEYIIGLTHTDQHFAEIVELIAPQGRFALIDDPAPLDINKLKPKSVSLHWESMFTRSSFQTPDMIEQHRILQQISTLVDEGRIRTTLNKVAGRIDAANLRAAHAAIESHTSIGKIVLEGF
ncbi:MAG: zinc-binding alcohol dehydrogenase family protein [Candidatus Korobacteraceae bacterium]